MIKVEMFSESSTSSLQARINYWLENDKTYSKIESINYQIVFEQVSTHYTAMVVYSTKQDRNKR